MHYHGTPITPRAALLTLAGRCFCVPYTEPRDLEVCHEIGQSVMLDNGAFTIWKTMLRGKPLPARLVPASQGDWSGYYAWVEPWLDRFTTWAVIPDVIEGDEDANDALVAEWPFGDRGAPVWHMHESIDRLDSLVARWPLVCVGSSGDFADLGTPRWQRRMAEAMDAACDTDGVPRTRLHMLRGLTYSDGPYPFFSADAATVGRNHAGTNSGRARRDPRVMVEEIDARQPASRWLRGHDQMSMEAA